MPQFNVTPARHGEWSLYGGRFIAKVPAVATVTPDADDRDPLDIRIRLTIDIVNGRLQCAQLVAERLDGDDAPPVTSENVRRVPVADYVRRAALQGGILQERIWLNANESELVDFRPPPVDFAASGMGDETLEQVARVYAAAQATGGKPTGVLQADYGMPRATSSRWVATARRRGILVEEHHQVMREPNEDDETTAEEFAELDKLSQQMVGDS
jgi:hypothetical protein